MRYSIALVCIGLMFYGCEKPPSYSDMPVIHFLSMTPGIVSTYQNPNTDAQGLSDSVNIQISFTDGNGAIGIPGNDTADYDAFLIDSRPTPNGQPYVTPYRIPYVTPNGNIKAISGTITIDVPYVIGRTDAAHTAWDTLYYKVYIEDRNGKLSDTVQTPPLYIKDN